MDCEAEFTKLPAKVQFSLKELKDGLINKTEDLIDSGLFFDKLYDPIILTETDRLLKRWASLLNLSDYFSNTGQNLREFLELYKKRNKMGFDNETKLAITHAYLIIKEYVKIPE